MNTTERYATLRNNQVNESYYTIAVTPGGHKTPMALPKLFQNASYAILRFSDTVGNKVTLYPNIKYVIGFFECGQGLTQGMPDSYRNYYVRFRNNASTTAVDVEHILRWTRSKQLVLLDGGQLALQLSRRVKEMKAMEDLTELTISVGRESCQSLEVDTFLRHVPELRMLTLTVDALDSKEITAFLNSQRIPHCWQMELDDENSVVRFVLVGRKSHFLAGLVDKLHRD